MSSQDDELRSTPFWNEATNSWDGFVGVVQSDPLTVNAADADPAVAALTVTAPQHDAGEATFQTMVTVFNQDNHGVTIGASGRMYVDANVNSQPAMTIVQEGTGAILSVQDANFNEVLRVDADGSVHIKTGSSLLADL